MSEFSNRRAPLITLIAGCALIAAAWVYVGAHWLLPSDGTTLNFSQSPPASGLPLRLFRTGQAGLQTGDVVVAIDGRHLDDLLALWPGRAPAPVGGEARLIYRVERAGSLVDVLVPLRRYDAVAALGDNWIFELALAYLFLVSSLVFALRPGLPVARALFLLSASLLASSTVFFLGLQASDLRYTWIVALWLWSTVVLFGVAMGGLVHFSLVFPRVHPAIRRHPAILALVYAGPWVPYLILLGVIWPPATTAAARLSVLVRATAAITLVCFLLLLVNCLVAYRSSQNETERRQLRWYIWGIYAANAPFVALDVVPGLLGFPPVIPPFLLGILWCAIPTALAIAILRERLFDIDVIIRRTLVYSTLTVALALVYFVSVVALQAGFVSLTGQNRSTLVTVLSTLAIASLFGPARRWVQALIDRRFYRRKYDAARALQAFGAGLRDAIELDGLAGQLLDIVDETMQPAEVSLWLRKPHS